MNYSLDEKIGCLSREVNMRRRVYGRQVSEGRMDALKAETEISIMAEILSEYQAQRDALQPSLFGEGGE